MLPYERVETRHGMLPLAGRVLGDATRPVLLIVTGAFPPKGHMHHMVEVFPHASVIVAGLPNMVGPAFADERPEVFAEAFDEAVERVAPGRAVVTYGISTGCLATLAMRSSQIRRHVAEEPFFSTARLWPFIADARRRLATFPDSKDLASFLWNLFGIGPDRLEDRDYRWLLADLRVATEVLVGAVPLEPERELPVWPSFTSAEDRAALATHPLVTVHEGPAASGHYLAGLAGGRELVHRVLTAALEAAAAEPIAGR